jgi:hypothetical protein
MNAQRTPARIRAGGTNFLNAGREEHAVVELRYLQGIKSMPSLN